MQRVHASGVCLCDMSMQPIDANTVALTLQRRHTVHAARLQKTAPCSGRKVWQHKTERCQFCAAREASGVSQWLTWVPSSSARLRSLAQVCSAEPLAVPATAPADSAAAREALRTDSESCTAGMQHMSTCMQRMSTCLLQFQEAYRLFSKMERNEVNCAVAK